MELKTAAHAEPAYCRDRRKDIIDFMQPKKTLIASVVVLAASLAFSCSIARAAGPDTYTLNPVAGKAICASANISARIGRSAALCVTKGAYSPDLYEVRIDGVTVVKGTDDETTGGIAATYRGRLFDLVCTSVLSASRNVTDAQVDSIRAMAPDTPREQLKQLSTLFNMVETGRRCVVGAQSAQLFMVEVRFE
ncbi:hypothetical protein [Burkholderia pyrrocinia]|uniref:hypothetical protein n=1 Tax=Burkholderia pyrrocinia TaxID=60550 RepID=UPI0015885A58|nr:hypothetical protein [Burkholderia pyrrocinia]